MTNIWMSSSRAPLYVTLSTLPNEMSASRASLNEETLVTLPLPRSSRTSVGGSVKLWRSATPAVPALAEGTDSALKLGFVVNAFGGAPDNSNRNTRSVAASSTEATIAFDPGSQLGCDTLRSQLSVRERVVPAPRSSSM